ncbi:PA0069 family radical SAM protein [Sphingobacterium alkalisoli]|uniref:PA0069 family radical SAM protein n=1 Tax=Sphingobacterium alkalisoli TaxID=1874115 RepID=A0A4U0H263_9SPHI|nr:PA0069 family radical SAM protein [Sphingobacterium alkalisoli]TJY65546.1 PA0069 family radical SAM protein [Sphingobacterium alkalisoli]GGH19813.1 radical SAM protein [Sphingobacterium alkalisoli]
MQEKDYIKGRGAQYNPHSVYKKAKYTIEHIEAIDDWESENNRTTFIHSEAKSLVHKVDSPDVGMMYSANPYQGCEHGCIYCYARNSHQYWDLSSGLDFERKIIVKENAPELFEKFISKKEWPITPIHLSGNTDCYQPAERKFRLTRRILEIALRHKQPISIITKNSLILRDADILEEMATHNLVRIFMSINSLTEETRLKLEPRTATASQRFRVIEELSKKGIPTGVNVAPVIPGLTDHEIPAVLKETVARGAKWASYIIVRLNGQIGEVFKDWLTQAYPDRADKIWHGIQSCHEGQVNNSNFGLRMKGSGKVAEIIRDSFRLHCAKYGLNRETFEYNCTGPANATPVQLTLF